MSAAVDAITAKVKAQIGAMPPEKRLALRKVALLAAQGAGEGDLADRAARAHASVCNRLSPWERTVAEAETFADRARRWRDALAQATDEAVGLAQEAHR